MKKIGIIELAFHNEVLKNYCAVLLAARYELIIFSNEFNHTQLALVHEKVKWILKGNEQTDPSFLMDNIDLLNECSLLIFTTITNDLTFYQSLKTTGPQLMVMHDIVAFISPRKSFLIANRFPEKLKDIIKAARFYLIGESKKRLSLVQSFDWLILPSKAMKSYLDQRQRNIPPSIVFDFAIHEKMLYKTVKETITLTIPGVVSDKSRDYAIVLDAFHKIKLNSKVRLVLLGKPKGEYGKRIVRNFLKMESPNFKINHFDSFIDQPFFDETLTETDFLLLPIAKYMKVGIFKELNGHTCVSGNINDMYRFGIPALLPAFYPLPEEVEPMVGRFVDANDLANKLSCWIEHKEYLSRRELAKNALKNFTVKQKAIEISNVLKSIRG